MKTTTHIIGLFLFAAIGIAIGALMGYFVHYRILIANGVFVTEKGFAACYLGIPLICASFFGYIYFKFIWKDEQ